MLQDFINSINADVDVDPDPTTTGTKMKQEMKLLVNNKSLVFTLMIIMASCTTQLTLV